MIIPQINFEFFFFFKYGVGNEEKSEILVRIIEERED